MAEDQEIQDAELVEDEHLDGEEHEDTEDSSEETPDEGAESAELEEVDEERAAIRERRRLEKQQKRQAAKDREVAKQREIQALRQEKEELAARLSALERRAIGSEMSQLDEAIQKTAQAGEYFKLQIKAATEANDGAAVAEATEKLWEVKKHYDHLNNIKRQAVNADRQQEVRSPIDPQVRQNAENWASKHTWYDPQIRDADSRVAFAVDQSMADEGWNPQMSEYWAEFDARLKKYLPHRYASAAAPKPRAAGSPVASGGREGNTGTTPARFTLSPQRVAAIKEAGKWDDVEARNKMIATYKAYDKQNAG